MQAVIFDMDGLMFDTESVYTLVGNELMRRRGREFTDEVKHQMMGLQPRATFEVMIRCYGLDDSWEQLAAESNKIFVSLLDEHLRPMPGIFELLDALEAAEVPKAIATSSCRQLTDEILTRAKLASRFAFILTAEDIAHGKPDPEIYLTAAARFHLDPSETLVLEDSQNGCRSAVAAGTFAVAVPNRDSITHDFSTASLVIDSLADPRLYEVLGIPQGN